MGVFPWFIARLRGQIQRRVQQLLVVTTLTADARPLSPPSRTPNPPNTRPTPVFGRVWLASPGKNFSTLLYFFTELTEEAETYLMEIKHKAREVQ